MKKNKLNLSLALASLCLLGTEISYAAPTDNLTLAIRCFTVSHNLQELIPEQTDAFCKENLTKSVDRTQESGQLLITKENRGAIQSLHRADFLLSDSKMTTCVKSQTINSLLKEIKGIADAVAD